MKIFKDFKTVRIVERKHVDGNVEYVIQVRNIWSLFSWHDAWLDSWAGAACRDTFPTLDEARKNICYFDNSKHLDSEVQGV